MSVLSVEQAKASSSKSKRFEIHLDSDFLNGTNDGQARSAGNEGNECLL